MSGALFRTNDNTKGISPEQIIDYVEKGIIHMEKFKKTPIVLMHDGTEIKLSADKPGNIVHSYSSDVIALPVINIVRFRISPPTIHASIYLLSIFNLP